MDTKWTHKGVEIEFDATDGKFRAKFNGQRQQFPSLAAAKKAIDKGETFKPFTALRKRNWDDPKGVEYVEVQIVGIANPRGNISYNNKPKWVTAEGHHMPDVYEDTPENRQALADRSAMFDRHSAEEEKRREEKQAMNERVKLLKPPLS